MKKNFEERLRKEKRGDTHDGTIRISPRGGILPLPEKSVIEIPPENMGMALHGDLVRVRVTKTTPPDRKFGEVVEVLARRKEFHVGVLLEKQGIFLLDPDDSRMLRTIRIPKIKTGGAKPKEKVAVRITKWENASQDPEGEVVKVLGKPLQHETEMLSILYDKGVGIGFPHKVEEEAEKAKYFLESPDVKLRRDLTKIPTFTIDPANAKDFDDALSVEKKGDLVEVGVHIADVSHFVRPGTHLDEEAARRATSTYLVDRTIHMLPEVLSQDLCSLNPNEEKFAFSVIFSFQKDGTITKEWFGKTKILSKKRFTYEEANDVLSKKCGPFLSELLLLKDIGDKLRKKKFEAGAIEFRDDDIYFELDAHGKPIRIERKKRLPTHLLIEELMLLANRRVAEFVDKLEKRSKIPQTFVYRVHDLPDRNKVQRIVTLLRRLGYDVHINPHITSGDINKILSLVKGKPEEALINQAAIQSMAKAVYTIRNIGHFGLAFPHYTHFTSPIRRYPDIIVHRLFDAYLHKKTITQKEYERYEELAEYASQMERIAEEAERESKKFKQAEYMKSHIGKEFNGVISGALKFGIFVEEEKTGAEGLVSVRDLPDDFYEYDESQIALIGSRTKRKLQLGKKVRVRVKSVDVRRKEINYLLI